MSTDSHSFTEKHFICEECGADVPRVYASEKKHYCIKCLMEKYKKKKVKS